MRLINVKTQKLETLKLEDFTSGERQYAILSHTWGTEEITISEMQSQPENNKADWRNKAGWRKIIRSCEQAQKDECDYVWCDTCCIDKNSSAELSESINSMFRWYQEAKVCYAYLEDVEEVDELPRARWFTRGWTLQELIAPKSLVFYVDHEYNTAWREIGTRKKLASKIQGITGIDESFLRGAGSRRELREASFAKRVAWAADRKTERSEDIAYCLMGLLDVNMPLLYGEGGIKAFRRLQEEYLKVNPDQSFLAWLLPSEDEEPRATSDGNLLAGHPDDFRKCKQISLASDDAAPFTLNNKGLQIRLPLFQNGNVNAVRNTEYFAILACCSDAQPDYRIRIPLCAVERSAETFTLFPGREHVPVLPDEFDDAHMTNCVILRAAPPLHPRLLSVNYLNESLISWKPKIVYLNPSTWTWNCLSKPRDLDPSILRPELSSRFPPIRVPGQRERASYGVLLQPPSSYLDSISNGCEDIPCSKVLIRVNVGFKERYEADVLIQLFHVAKNEISTDLEDTSSIPPTAITSNSRSRMVSIPTQLSETIHASAAWKRSSNQDELSLKIDLAAADKHHANELNALSTTQYNSLLSEDPLVRSLYFVIAISTLLMLGRADLDPYETIGAGIAFASVYFKRWETRFAAYVRPEFRAVFVFAPCVLGIMLLSHSSFVEYNENPAGRSRGAYLWQASCCTAILVLISFAGHLGYESPNKEEPSAEELDPRTGLKSLLFDDII